MTVLEGRDNNFMAHSTSQYEEVIGHTGPTCSTFVLVLYNDCMILIGRTRTPSSMFHGGVIRQLAEPGGGDDKTKQGSDELFYQNKKRNISAYSVG